MGADAPDGRPMSAPRRCAICGKPATPADEPFCSSRCANVDLHRWLGGVYAVPAAESDDESDRSSEDEI